MKLLDEIRNLEEEMIADRRSLHKMPELSSHEEKTTAFIKTRLTDFGVETEDLNIPTGVCAHPGQETRAYDLHSTRYRRSSY